MNMKKIFFALIVTTLLIGSACAVNMNEFKIDGYNNSYGSDYSSAYVNNNGDSGVSIYKTQKQYITTTTMTMVMMTTDTTTMTTMTDTTITMMIAMTTIITLFKTAAPLTTEYAMICKFPKMQTTQLHSPTTMMQNTES